jgi:hypothetical protein
MLWLQRWNFIERAKQERALWEAFERGEDLEALVAAMAEAKKAADKAKKMVEEAKKQVAGFASGAMASVQGLVGDAGSGLIAASAGAGRLIGKDMQTIGKAMQGAATPGAMEKSVKQGMGLKDGKGTMGDAMMAATGMGSGQIPGATDPKRVDGGVARVVARMGVEQHLHFVLQAAQVLGGRCGRVQTSAHPPIFHRQAHHPIRAGGGQTAKQI